MRCEYEMAIRWQNAVVTLPRQTLKLTLTLAKLSHIKRGVSARWPFRKLHFQNSSLQEHELLKCWEDLRSALTIVLQ